MSLIIKGMKMPKRHLFEAFVAIGDGQIVVKDLEKNKLFAGKIEEVRTPHGRLIDADILTKILQDTLDNYSDNYNDGKTVEKLVVDVCKQYIEHSPTIIEAEVSE